jgi:hypothetical protein
VQPRDLGEPRVGSGRKKALRLFAWRSTPRIADSRIDTREPYSCTRDCKTKQGDWDRARRAARGCTRPDLPRVEWSITARELYTIPTINPICTDVHMGRAPIDAVEVPGNNSATHPAEPASDGCPGGWYRTAYVGSVIPYLRRRTDGGGRVSNPVFDRANHLIQAAALEVEREQERWHGRIAELSSERARAQAEKRKREAKTRGPRGHRRRGY